jgi:2-polyprenyl-3-methyl-5-hydroxy-6-metoxy-1,4-benzoquinol methylase
MNTEKSSCFVCGATVFQDVFGSRVVDRHRFFKCSECGTVVARPVELQEPMDYTEYGDYLVDDRIINKHLKSKRRYAARLLDKKGDGERFLLDFGAGAGYFVKAARELGFRTIGVEPSAKLRTFASERLDLQLYAQLRDVKENFDVITIFDVIEHIPEQSQRELMSELVSRLKPGGVLVGQTPNWQSVNRLIRAEKDPAIWPPSHVSYFTPRSLHIYLESLGLKRERLYTKGFRSFRKNKDEYSFLEKSATSVIARWCLIYPLLVGMKLLSYILSSFGMGYHTYFAYRKEWQE